MCTIELDFVIILYIHIYRLELYYKLYKLDQTIKIQAIRIRVIKF